MSTLACIPTLRFALPALGLALASSLIGQDAPPLLRLDSLSAEGTTAHLTFSAPAGAYLIQSSQDLTTGSWLDARQLLFDDATASASFALATGVGPREFYRAIPQEPAAVIEIQSAGAGFAPVVECSGGTPAALLWRWSDGTVNAATLSPIKSFGSPAARSHRLEVFAPTQLTSLNFGHDGGDGGEGTPLAHIPAQNLTAISFPDPLPGVTSFGATGNTELRSVDFTNLTGLEYIECFLTTNLEHVTVHDIPTLRRVCFEDCNLAELDLSGLPNLGDLRGALNNYTEIRVDRGTGPKVWHWCTRDNPQMTQNFADIMGDFVALEELYIWNTNQRGAFTVGSLVLRDFQAGNNHYTSVSLPGRSQLQILEVSHNEISTFDLTGCTALVRFNAAYNQLAAATIDALLRFFDTSCPNITFVDLTANRDLPSATAIALAQSLRAKGATVLIDVLETGDGEFDIPGDASSITFTTNGPQVNMQIQVSDPHAVVTWHWGDGAITTGSHSASHTFTAAAPHTNYVRVVPATAVTYFGAQSGLTAQGITSVTGVANFPNLDFLYLYDESLIALDLAGCANLRQLHLAANPVPRAVCDKWFVDLDAAVPGPVTGADFFFPASARSSASDAAYESLIAKGYAMHPF